MILKGAVLIPHIKDKSGDVLDEETIRKAALVISRNGILIDVQHKLRFEYFTMKHTFYTHYPFKINKKKKYAQESRLII